MLLILGEVFLYMDEERELYLVFEKKVHWNINHSMKVDVIAIKLFQTILSLLLPF